LIAKIVSHKGTINGNCLIFLLQIYNIRGSGAFFISRSMDVDVFTRGGLLEHELFVSFGHIVIGNKRGNKKEISLAQFLRDWKDIEKTFDWVSKHKQLPID